MSESAAQLVERLTREGFDSLRDDVAHGRRETGLKSLDERGAMSEIVRDQYTGRYPLELIQNANDAEASAGSTGSNVKFVVTDTALMVADQGAGFGVDEVRAICGLARSSKDPRKNVGYKGLGFKSVREITDLPQIISSAVRFGFDAERLRREIEAIAGELPDGQRLPDYAFPFTLTDEDLGDDFNALERLLSEGFRTVMRLPFRDPALREDVAKHVAEVVAPELLLFLDATESLELVGTTADQVAVAAHEDREDHQYLVLESDGVTEEFLIFRRHLPIPDRNLVAGLGRAWQQVEFVRVIAAVPMGADGPDAQSIRPLHVYFPTEERTGFSIVLHADFQLDLDRQRISRAANAADYNRWLRGALVEFVAGEVVPWLASRYPGIGVLDALAARELPTGEGATLRMELLQRMREVRWLPCRDGLHSPPHARLVPATVPDLGALHSWLPEGRPYLLPAAEERPEIRKMLVDELGVTAVTPAGVLAELTPPDEEGSVRGFYEFLVEWSQRQGWFPSALKGARCVRLRGGTWVSPEEPAFLPRQRNEADFPSELSIPIVDVPDVDGLDGLLESAGVKPLSWRTVVTDFLMPLLTEDETSEETWATAMEALRTYYDSMRGESGDQTIRDAVQKVLLPARASAALEPDTGADDEDDEDEVEWREAGALYFGADWLPDSDLETIYGNPQRWDLQRSDFLGLDAPTDPDELDASRSFYAWLGVADRPRLAPVTKVV